MEITERELTFQKRVEAITFDNGLVLSVARSADTELDDYDMDYTPLTEKDAKLWASMSEEEQDEVLELV